MHIPRLKKQGFTLIEIIVSMIILALLASGFFSIMVSSRYLVMRSRMRLLATELASQQIERLKQYVRDDTWAVAGNPLDPTGIWNAIAGMPAPYTGDYKVESGPPNTDYRKVTVRVRWNEPQI